MFSWGCQRLPLPRAEPKPELIKIWSITKTTPVSAAPAHEASPAKTRLVCIPTLPKAALPTAALPKAIAPQRSLRKATAAAALVCAVLLAAALALPLVVVSGEAAGEAGPDYCYVPGLSRTCPAKSYHVSSPAPTASFFQLQCLAGSASVCQLLDNPALWPAARPVLAPKASTRAPALLRLEQPPLHPPPGPCRLLTSC
jgi:hypothetical protein